MWWYLRRIVRDHRRDVILNREPNTEGHVISTGPYDDPAHALRYGIASFHDPAREMGSMDFQNIDLIEGERPAPSFAALREALAAGPDVISALYERYQSTKVGEQK